MTKRISFLVQGRVQGVNFRNFTISQAQTHGVTGWVRNNESEGVEGEAQGNEDALRKFIKDIDEGPRAAKVMKLDTKDIPVKEGESDFTLG